MGRRSLLGTSRYGKNVASCSLLVASAGKNVKHEASIQKDGISFVSWVSLRFTMCASPFTRYEMRATSNERPATSHEQQVPDVSFTKRVTMFMETKRCFGMNTKGKSEE